MKRNKILFALILLVVTLGSGEAAFAKGPGETTGRAAERRLSGVIVEVNRQERLIIVKDAESGENVSVYVPKGQVIQLRESGNVFLRRNYTIELAMKGMIVDLRVAPRA